MANLKIPRRYFFYQRGIFSEFIIYFYLLGIIFTIPILTDPYAINDETFRLTVFLSNRYSTE